MKYNLTIGWLYPELMSTYGDRGNIIALQKRALDQKIEVKIKKLDVGFKKEDLLRCDFLFMGGGEDQQQKIVANDLLQKSTVLKKIIEDETPGLYICGAYQFLGKYYKDSNGEIIKCLEILDFYTENPGKNSERLIGNIAIKTFDKQLVIGFENHGGRTYLSKNIKPFGKVLEGLGNNGLDKTEGAIYKNSFCTYLHGPILPKNPKFTDYLLKTSIEKKYNISINLNPTDNLYEEKAREKIAKTLNIRL